MKLIATASSGILRNIVDSICLGEMRNPLSEDEFFQFMVWLTEQEDLTCTYNSTTNEKVRAEFDKLGFVAGMDYKWLLERRLQPTLAGSPNIADIPSTFELSVESAEETASLTNLAEGAPFDFGIREKFKRYRGDLNRAALEKRKLLRLKVSNYLAGMDYTPHVGDIVRLRSEFYHVAPAWMHTADMMVLAIGDGWAVDRDKGKIHLDNNIGVAYLTEEGNLQMCPMNSTMVELRSLTETEGHLADWLDDDKRAEKIKLGGRLPALRRDQ